MPSKPFKVELSDEFKAEMVDRISKEVYRLIDADRLRGEIRIEGDPPYATGWINLSGKP